MEAILIYKFFAKNAKHKNACISKTVPDRGNSAKSLTHRVSVRTSLSKFQRIFHLPKMAAFLNFQIFFKNAKHKNACISKTVLNRAISMKFLTRRITLMSSRPNFQKKNCPVKNGGHFEFSNFSQKSQNTKKNPLVFRKQCDIE